MALDPGSVTAPATPAAPAVVFGDGRRPEAATHVQLEERVPPWQGLVKRSRSCNWRFRVRRNSYFVSV